MAKRKVIKLDKNGIEMKDENDNFILEEIEIPDINPQSEDSNQNSESDIEEQIKKRVAEEMETYKAEVAKTNNISQPNKKIEKPIEDEVEQKTSMGYDPKTMKIVKGE